jgi:predicted Zn-dependent protease
MRFALALLAACVAFSQAPDKERALRAAIDAHMQKTHGFLDAPELTGYLNRMAARLSPLAGDVLVLDTEEALASSAPGRVYLSRGFLLKQRDELTLARALGHQIAHMAIKPATDTHAAIPVFSAGGLCYQAHPSLAYRSSLPFETEADRVAAEYAGHAGYGTEDSQEEFERVRALIPRPPPRGAPTLRRASDR